MAISKSTIVLIILGLSILGAAAYLFFGKGDISAALTSSNVIQGEAETTFLQLTEEIKSLKFDTRILSDVRFRNLVDIHTILTPEASGRKDPFAPFSLGR